MMTSLFEAADVPKMDRRVIVKHSAPSPLSRLVAIQVPPINCVREGAMTREERGWGFSGRVAVPGKLVLDS